MDDNAVTQALNKAQSLGYSLPEVFVVMVGNGYGESRIAGVEFQFRGADGLSILMDLMFVHFRTDGHAEGRVERETDNLFECYSIFYPERTNHSYLVVLNCNGELPTTFHARLREGGGDHCPVKLLTPDGPKNFVVDSDQWNSWLI